MDALELLILVSAISIGRKGQAIASATQDPSAIIETCDGSVESAPSSSPLYVAKGSSQSSHLTDNSAERHAEQLRQDGKATARYAIDRNPCRKPPAHDWRTLRLLL